MFVDSVKFLCHSILILFLCQPRHGKQNDASCQSSPHHSNNEAYTMPPHPHPLFTVINLENLVMYYAEIIWKFYIVWQCYIV